MIRNPLRVATLAGLALALALPATSRGGEHVRVVLDVSKSMRKTDPARLAPLSAVLLYDLAAPNVTLDDSFAVIPFHLTRKWPDPSQPPPTETGEPIRPGRDREKLVERVLDLPYDAAWTYYYPGLRRAIGELTAVGGQRDVRTVVLVTDGLPEPPTRKEELRRIQEDLLPLLEEHGIRFYVLAFGPEADANRDFFSALTRPPSGGSLGELFVDRDGSRLLPNMAEIFSRSFGYTQEAVGRLPGVGPLDLEGGVAPDRVAVVVYSPSPPEPALDLDPPAGVSVHAPDDIRGAATPGASYSLLWVLSPHAGRYALSTDRSSGQVAVLRPSRLEAELRPVPPMSRLDRVMAEQPFQVEALVRPAAGAPGDPGAVDLFYQVFGPRDPAGQGYRWDGQRQAPPPNSGRVVPEGRSFRIEVEMPQDPAAGDGPAPGPYIGFLEVEVYRREALVGALGGSRAHRLEVHPFLAVHPSPVQGDARPAGGGSSPALHRDQEGCSRFELRVDAGSLPHPDDPRYPVRVVIDSAVTLDGPLEGATFTLDGLPLEVEGRPGPHPGDWYRGRMLERDRLLGEHVACVRLGKPTTGDPSKPVTIPILFTLQESPYDAFDVVRPFTLAAWVAPPTFVDRWQPVLVSTLLLLLLMAALWYLKYRPDLPADLRVAVDRADSSAPLVGRALPPPQVLVRLLALRPERPVDVPGEDLRLGRLRPVDGQLYRFRPGRGVRVLDDEGRPLPSRFGTVEVEVRRPYRVSVGDTLYRMRVEYAR